LTALAAELLTQQRGEHPAKPRAERLNRIGIVVEFAFEFAFAFAFVVEFAFAVGRRPVRNAPPS
jgi:hypothetical protein